jgi:hypothetical protein
MKKLLVIAVVLFTLLLLLPRQTGHKDGADQLRIVYEPR